MRRTLAAALVALPYLAASTLGIASFKELLAGLFLLAFALILRDDPARERGARRPDRRARRARRRRWSPPTATRAWPGSPRRAALWAARRARSRAAGTGAGRGPGRPAQGGAAADRRRRGRCSSLAIARAAADQGLHGLGRGRDVSGTDSKLRYAVPCPEALGVWPSGEFLFGNSDQGLTPGSSSRPSGSPASASRLCGGWPRRRRPARGGRGRRRDLPRDRLEGRPLRRGQGAGGARLAGHGCSSSARCC